MRRPVGLLLVLFLVTLPGTAPAVQQGPDYFATDNVRFIKSYPEVTDGVGGRVVGNHLYVTSTKGIHIFDISAPEDPKPVGMITVQAHWENEQVPTNGKILGISSSDGCMYPDPNQPMFDPRQNNRANCLTIYDVRDPANPVRLTSVWGAGAHTNTCLWDCAYMWGSNGAVTDLTHVFDAGHPAPIIGYWDEGTPGENTAHHQTEVRPGVVLSATQPVMLLSTRKEDGGTVWKPKLLATGKNADERFIHSTEWPQQGTDKFALVGGETNAVPQCSLETTAAFMTWDTSKVSEGKLEMIDEYRLHQGTYSDGSAAVNVLGCSVHWLEAHPSFHNGGLVALGAYEHGTRFLRIDAAGKIHEAGWFIPMGGSTSAPHWAPDGKTVYAVDYARGLDVIQWTGPTYVPAPPKPATTARVKGARRTQDTLPNTGTEDALPLALLLLVAAGRVAMATRRDRISA